jgi:hypothetical protein
MYFPDPERAETMMEFVGDSSPTINRTVTSLPMTRRTAFKCMASLIECGLLWVTPGIPGMVSGKLNAEGWNRLDDSQRERAVRALGRIAAALEAIA